MGEILAATDGGNRLRRLRHGRVCHPPHRTTDDRANAALAEEVQSGGQPPDPRGTRRYLDRLLLQTAARVRAVVARQATTDALMVPGSRLLLETLAGRSGCSRLRPH